VRCPACQHRFQIEKDSLGSEITCTREGCNTRLRINSFVIQQPVQKENSVVIKQTFQGENSGVIQQPTQSENSDVDQQPEPWEDPVVIQQPEQKKRNWFSKLIKK
jgi:hypothetical protein